MYSSKENLKFFMGAFCKNFLSYGLHYFFFIYLGSLTLFGEFFVLYLFLKFMQVISLFGTNRLILSRLPQALLDNRASQVIHFSYLMISIFSLLGGSISIFCLKKLSHLNLSYSGMLMIVISLLIINFLFISRTILRVLKKQIMTNVFFEFLIDLLTMYLPFVLITHSGYPLYIIPSVLFFLGLSYYSLHTIQHQTQVKLFKNVLQSVNFDDLKESFWFMLQALQKLFFYYINFFILSLSHGLSATGMYSAVWVVFRIANITNKASSQSSTVSVAERKNQPQWMAGFVKENLIFRMVVVSILFIGVDALFYYQLPSQHFIYLSIIFYFALLLNCFNSLSINILNNTGRAKMSLRNLFIKNFSKLILSQILVIYWGSYGAAFAFLMAQLIVLMSNHRFLYSGEYYKKTA